MLIVFSRFPVSAPLKASFLKRLNTQIIGADLIEKLLFSIGIWQAGFGTHKRSFICFDDIGVIERINIDSHSVAVIRQHLSTLNKSEIEGRRIVVTHGFFVIGSVIIN